jgi:hypothetical protein
VSNEPRGSHYNSVHRDRYRYSDRDQLHPCPDRHVQFQSASLPHCTFHEPEPRAAAGIRNELSFTSFRHGGFTEGADSDLTDAELCAAGRHRSARQLPTYAKRTRKQLISGTKKRREERTKQPICRNSR